MLLRQVKIAFVDNYKTLVENWITLNNVLNNINYFVLSVLDILTVVLNRFRHLNFNYFKMKIVRKKLHKKRLKMILMRLVQFIFKTVAKLKTKAVLHWTLILIVSVKWVFVDMSMSMDIVFISLKQNNFRYSRCIYNRQIELWEKIKRQLEGRKYLLRKNNRSVSEGRETGGGRLRTIRMMFSFHLTSSIFFALFAQKKATGIVVFISVYYCISNDGQE